MSLEHVIYLPAPVAVGYLLTFRRTPASKRLPWLVAVVGLLVVLVGRAASERFAVTSSGALVVVLLAVWAFLYVSPVLAVEWRLRAASHEAIGPLVVSVVICAALAFASLYYAALFVAAGA